MKSEIKGIITPVHTTFTEDGLAIDEAAFTAHIDRVLAAGIKNITIAGGTGEMPFLSKEEKKQLLEVAVNHVAGRANVIAHASATHTAEALELVKHAEQAGANCILLLPPYFEGPEEEGVIEYYTTVAAATSLPIMAYNIPVFSGFDITPEIWDRLCLIENIHYLKDSTGDFKRIRQLQAKGCKVFNGADFTMLESMMAGCQGSFWGGSNAFPAEAVKLEQLVTDKEYEAAQTQWQKLLPFSILLWTESYNPLVKAATNLLGGNVGECRHPVQPPTEKQLEMLRDSLTALL